VSESTKELPLLQPKMQPLSKRTRPKTKPLPTLGLTKKESTLRSEKLKQWINYREKDDDDEEGEVDNEEYDEFEWKSNHTVINSGNSRPTIGLTKTESTVQSRSSKRRKTNNKHDHQDKDDDAEEYDESERENNQQGINSDKSKWSSRYKDKSFWPDKGGYNLEEWEFKEKEKWATPAACMDNSQHKTLEQSIRTWQKCASRYSQRPGQNWPAQEWVLLQITDIYGVGKKSFYLP
jgi:hypothetical protein